MSTIFLSHSSKDKEFVRKLAKDLEDHDLKIWLDEKSMKVGDLLIPSISDGIKNSNYLIAVISENSNNSVWVNKELSIAISEEVLTSHKKILPILLDKCEIPIFLQDKVYADFSDPKNYNKSFAQLLLSIEQGSTGLKVIPKRKYLQPKVEINGLVKEDIFRLQKNTFYFTIELSHEPSYLWQQWFYENLISKDLNPEKTFIAGNTICHISSLNKFIKKDAPLIKDIITITNDQLYKLNKNSSQQISTYNPVHRVKDKKVIEKALKKFKTD